MSDNDSFDFDKHMDKILVTESARDGLTTFQREILMELKMGPKMLNSLTGEMKDAALFLARKGLVVIGETSIKAVDQEISSQRKRAAKNQEHPLGRVRFGGAK